MYIYIYVCIHVHTYSRRPEDRAKADGSAVRPTNKQTR